MARSSMRKGAGKSAGKAVAHRSPRRAGSDRLWSARVTRDSHALDLEEGVFTWSDPNRIAVSLKRSAERSHWRKADPFRSALSMLTFYINRAGTNLSPGRRRVLQHAKVELRKAFGRE